MKPYLLAFKDNFASTSERLNVSADSIDEALEVGIEYAAQYDIQLESVHGADGESISITATSLSENFKIHECQFLLATDTDLIEESISALTLEMAVDLIHVMYQSATPVAVMTHNLRYLINPKIVGGRALSRSWRWVSERSPLVDDNFYSLGKKADNE